MNVMTIRLAPLAAICGMVLSAPALADGSGITGLLPSSIGVGGLAVAAPKYEGSKDYRVRAVPIAIPSGIGAGNGGFVQFRGPDDVRLRLFSANGFEAGPLLGWRFGRDQDDAARLRGLGDVDGGFVAGAYAGYRMGGLMPFVSYHRQLSGDETGGLVRFGLEGRTALAAGISVLATVGASYADDDYNSAFFSVTQAQSTASLAGLRVYDADAGIKDVYAGISADIPFADRWTLKLSGRYSRLVGDAADSPIVESQDQFSGGLGLTYRFDLGR